MVDRGIVPATVEFLGRVARANYYAGQTGVTSKATARLEQRLAESVDAVSACSEKLREKLAQLPCTSATEEACALHQIWREEMAQLRLAADKLEELCAADRWPFPAYTDLLFDICQQFGIHYYTATKKNAKKKTMPTALWHICSEHTKKALTKITVS